MNTTWSANVRLIWIVERGKTSIHFRQLDMLACHKFYTVLDDSATHFSKPTVHNTFYKCNLLCIQKSVPSASLPVSRNKTYEFYKFSMIFLIFLSIIFTVFFDNLMIFAIMFTLLTFPLIFLICSEEDR